MTTNYPRFLPKKVRELAVERQLGSFLLKNVNQFQRGYAKYLFEEGMIQVRTTFFSQSIQPLFYWRDVILFRSLGEDLVEFEPGMPVSQYTPRNVLSRYIRYLEMEFADKRTWKINLSGYRIVTSERYFAEYGVQDHEVMTS